MQGVRPGPVSGGGRPPIAPYQWRKGGIFAFLYIVFGSLSVFVSYIVAVMKGNVRAFLPFISKSGGMPPEHAIFNYFAYIAATCALGMITIRYMYVASQNKARKSRVAFINKLAYTCSLFCVMGLILLASYSIHLYHYQEVWKTSVLVPHMIGACMMFGFGGAYFTLQTVLSLFFFRTNKTLCVFRVAVSLIMSIPLGICAFKIWHFMEVSAPKYLTADFDNSTVAEEYSEPFLVCTVSEWLATILFLFYIATFVKECNTVSLNIFVRNCSPNIRSRLLTSVVSRCSDSDASSQKAEGAKYKTVEE